MESRSQTINNDLQSALMVLGIALILGACGFFLFGWFGLAAAVVGTLALSMVAPRISPKMIMSLYKARPVPVDEDSNLYEIVEELSNRAGLTKTPDVYYIPTEMVNAFAMGTRDKALIGITDGILKTLNARELTGVLAHEVSHVKNNDIRVMSIADLMARGTHMASMAGQALLVLNLFLPSDSKLSWLAIALLILAPSLSSLLQLGLSRAREYDADLGAAEITGDPTGLASALTKMEHTHSHAGGMQKVLLPGRKQEVPSMLRTHPETADRIARLQKLEGATPLPQIQRTEWSPAIRRAPALRAPRWHMSGLWY